MQIPLYQLDAFASQVFGGNPAAVCPLEQWLPAEVMQQIAAENNLAETAFFVPREEPGHYDLRWFTPTIEVDLCGHATLASAAVVLERLAPGLKQVVFHTRSGPLAVEPASAAELAMELPARPPKPWEEGTEAVAAALGRRPQAVWRSDKALALLASEAEVRAAAPNLERVAALPVGGLIVTAAGQEVDFVSRYFAPAAGIPEDPVTGSAHVVLTPFWAARLGKTRLAARQVSARGGDLLCELMGERVRMTGRVATYLEGTIRL